MTRTGPLPLRSEPALPSDLALALSHNDAELPTSAQLRALRARLPGNTSSSVTSDHAQPRLCRRPSKRFRAAVIFACLLLAAVAAAASYWAVSREKPNRSPPVVAPPLSQVAEQGRNAASAEPEPEPSAQVPVSEADANTPALPAPPQ